MPTLKKYHLILVSITTIILLSNLFTLSVMAVSPPPPLPNAFSGEVEINGAQAPVGTVIYAYIDIQNDTTPDASVTVSTTGHYSDLLVSGNDTDNKKEITFVIGESVAVEKAIFDAYAPAPTELNLSTTGEEKIVIPESSSVFEDTANPAEKEVTMQETETSEESVIDSGDSDNSLNGFSSALSAIALLGAVMIFSRFKVRGDSR